MSKKLIMPEFSDSSSSEEEPVMVEAKKRGKNKKIADKRRQQYKDVDAKAESVECKKRKKREDDDEEEGRVEAVTKSAKTSEEQQKQQSALDIVKKSASEVEAVTKSAKTSEGQQKQQSALDIVKKSASEMWLPFISDMGSGTWVHKLFTTVDPQDIFIKTRDVKVREKDKVVTKIYADVKRYADEKRIKAYSVTRWTVPLYADMAISSGDGTYGMEHSKQYWQAKFLFKLTDFVSPEMEEACGEGWKEAVDAYFDHMIKIQDRVLECLFDHDLLCDDLTKKNMINAQKQTDEFIKEGLLTGLKNDTPEYIAHIRRTALSSFKVSAHKFVEEKDGFRVMTVRRSAFKKMNEDTAKSAKDAIQKKKEALEASYERLHHCKPPHDMDILKTYVEENPVYAPILDFMQRIPLRVSNAAGVPFKPPADYKYPIVTKGAYIMANVQVQAYSIESGNYGVSLNLISWDNEPEIILYRRGDVYSAVKEMPAFKGAENIEMDYKVGNAAVVSNDLMSQLAWMKGTTQQQIDC